MKYWLLLTIIGFIGLAGNAATYEGTQYNRILADSVLQEKTTLGSAPSPAANDTIKEAFKRSLQKVTSCNAFQMTYIPAGLFIMADIAKSDNDFVRTTRNFNIPRFSYHYDDYLQYSSGVLTYALNLFGVEGRSSFKRLSTSTGISLAIMGACVNTLKFSVNKERPDGSANNSFPSGHTAMAFMTATWLHKEYGVTRSPIYSVLGYTTATSIAMGRVMNNKHWLSDVITGAGIGILSSELGYYLGDLIYKEKGLSKRSLKQALPPLDAHPTFWSITAGHSTRNNSIELNDNTSISVRTGFYIGIDGAYFLSPNFGIGSKLSIRTHFLNPNNPEIVINRPYFNGTIDYMEAGYLSVYSLMAGPYFSYPISRSISLGFNLLAGYSGTTSSAIKLAKKKQQPQEETKYITAYKSKTDYHLGFETGLSITTMVARNMGIKFFSSYAVNICRPKYSALSDFRNGEPVYTNYKEAKDATQNLVIGMGINGYFW